MARKHDALSRDLIDQTKLLYDAGVTPFRDVMAMLGMNVDEFRRFREREGWPMRPSPIKRKSAPAPASERFPIERNRSIDQNSLERNNAGAVSDPIESDTALASEPTAIDSRGLVARLEEAVERELARAETQLTKRGAKGATTIESSARVLASLVRSLAELKRMSRDAALRGAREEDESASGEPPRELAELREELARRLERLGGAGEIA